jgi:hypothetical protein
MDGIRRAAPDSATTGPRLGPTALLCAFALAAGLALSGCQVSAASTPASPGATGGVTASAAVSIPRTHRSTATYTISSPVSALVVTSQLGSVTVTGRSGSTATVTEDITYSRKPPVTTRAVSGGTLSVGYACPTELVCTVSYDIAVPSAAAVQVRADAGKIVLSALAGPVTAKADAGLITATGLTGASVSLTTDVGAITADFAAAPASISAVTRVGAITLTVPPGATYTVNANASVGRATVRIPQAPSAPHTITVTTDVGAILVD